MCQGSSVLIFVPFLRDNMSPKRDKISHRKRDSNQDTAASLFRTRIRYAECVFPDRVGTSWSLVPCRSVHCLAVSWSRAFALIIRSCSYQRKATKLVRKEASRCVRTSLREKTSEVRCVHSGDEVSGLTRNELFDVESLHVIFSDPLTMRFWPVFERSKTEQ
jgi:hypothetical protein